MCAIAVSACALSAQTVETTGMVGIAYAETAQLNLLNPGVVPPGDAVSCAAAVSFLDNNGVVLKTTTLAVAPGRSLPFTLRSDTDLSLLSGERREIRVTITIPAITPAIPACKLIPTLEILDTVSGRTLVILAPAATVPSVTTPQ